MPTSNMYGSIVVEYAIFQIYFCIHSNGIILLNNLHSRKHFIASDHEQEIYSFYLQYLFDI